MEKIKALASSAVVNIDHANVEWQGVEAAVREAGFHPDSVIAASWCVFETRNIEALIDSAALLLVFPEGLLSTAGKTALFGGRLKYSAIPFASCRAFGEADHQDERGFGKFCIEFGGPGGVLLGRLRWTWRAKRFRDSRAEIMAVAAERDRIHGIVASIIG